MSRGPGAGTTPLRRSGSDSRTESTCPGRGTYRVFTRTPSARMPSGSHLIRRTTVPDRPRWRLSRVSTRTPAVSGGTVQFR